MTILLTEHNHFKFGYDYEWYTPRFDASQRFTVAYGKADSALNWGSECIIAAKKIAATASGPIELLLSGGIDSEVAAQAFLLARVPFTAHILRFTDDLNEHDIVFARKFCEAHSLRYYLHDIDILEFFAGDLYHYAALSESVSPQLCATMWLIDRLDGYPVLGQGEPLLVRRPNQRWALRESEKINAWYRFFLNTDRQGVPGFHQYTPAQMLSYLLEFVNHPMLRPDSGKLSSLTSRLGMYRRYFALEPREKFTGYERIMDHDAEHRVRLKNLHPEHDDVCYLDYAFLLDHLRGYEQVDVAPP